MNKMLYIFYLVKLNIECVLLYPQTEFLSRSEFVPRCAITTIRWGQSLQCILSAPAAHNACPLFLCVWR